MHHQNHTQIVHPSETKTTRVFYRYLSISHVLSSKRLLCTSLLLRRSQIGVVISVLQRSLGSRQGDCTQLNGSWDIAVLMSFSSHKGFSWFSVIGNDPPASLCNASQKVQREFSGETTINTSLHYFSLANINLNIGCKAFSSNR